MYTYGPENIVALATPPGLGALAVIRFSGLNLCATYKAFSNKKPINRRATLSKIFHPKNGKVIDEGIIIYYKGPNSFTGEDVIEISCHGGQIVPNAIIQAAIDFGARIASPGEFSFRAFLNGKIDLLKAEAVSLLISSKSQFSADISMQHILGSVSKMLFKIRSNALDLLAIIENELNFSEDEINFVKKNELYNMVQKIKIDLENILESSVFGKNILSGVRIVIFGKPNSGKSSLFNSILGFERAIVSSLPGTTRDTIESYFELSGTPVCLIDTAGVWETDNILEKRGIERTYSSLEKADYCILVDENNPQKLLKSGFIKQYKGACILVQSKCDDMILKDFENNGVFYTSSKKGLGIKSLLTYLSTSIYDHINTIKRPDRVLINRRQRQLIRTSLLSINSILKQIDTNVSTDIVASSVHSFIDIIHDMVGEISNKEILKHIFSKFCVGK